MRNHGRRRELSLQTIRFYHHENLLIGKSLTFIIKQINMRINSKLPVEIEGYQYSRKAQLGKGAEGSVYKGVRQSDSQTVAIKEIKENDSPSQIYSYLFHCSLQAHKLFDHPNIQKVQSIQRSAGYCYIVSQLCEGGTLSSFIKNKGKLSQGQALELFEGIVEGYCAIAKEGILHRDLKTANILLKKNLQPVIIDFGLCDFMNSEKRPKRSYNVGSEMYMSPQVFNKNEYSQKSDIWALGIILNQMLTGSLLKMKTKNIDKFFKTLSKREYPQTTFHYQKEILSLLLRKCLAVNVEERATGQQLRTLMKEWKERNPN